MLIQRKMILLIKTDIKLTYSARDDDTLDPENQGSVTIEFDATRQAWGIVKHT